MRIRIALTAAIAATCMTTGIFVALGSAPSASAHDTTTIQPNAVQSAGSTTSTQPGAALADLAVPVVVHTAFGPAIAVGGSYLPAKAAPVPPTPPAPVAQPVAAPAPVPVNDSTSTDTGDWQCIRVHESGDNYNNPNMPSGAYGILISTWESFGYSGWPYEAAPGVQDALALRLYAEYGFAPWSSRYACGL